jgi:hypothetical protein
VDSRRSIAHARRTGVQARFHSGSSAPNGREERLVRRNREPASATAHFCWEPGRPCIIVLLSIIIETIQRAQVGECHSALPRNSPPRNRDMIPRLISFAMTP